MLPPTQYIQNHVYFTFVLFLTSYDSAYKKHTKDLSYAKPYYHTILPFIRKGVHFLMSFLLPSFCYARIFRTWDSLLCTEFTRNVLTLLIMQICLHSIPPPPPVLYKKKKKKKCVLKDTFVTSCLLQQESETQLIVYAMTDWACNTVLKSADVYTL